MTLTNTQWVKRLGSRGLCLGSLFLLLTAAAPDRPTRPLKICVLSQARLMRESPAAVQALAKFRGTRGAFAQQVANERAMITAETQETDRLVRNVDQKTIAARRAVTAARQIKLDTMLSQDSAALGVFNQTLTDAVNRAAVPAIMAEEKAQKCSILLAREYVLNVDDVSLDITSQVLARMAAAQPG